MKQHVRRVRSFFRPSGALALLDPEPTVETVGSEHLIPCGDLSSPRNRRDPKRSDGVAEYWGLHHIGATLAKCAPPRLERL
jgi:hypothetical protein